MVKEWKPDPTGRHQHRLWDETEFTDQVANNGVVSTDPLEAASVDSPLPPPPDAVPVAPPASKEPWWKRKWVWAVAAGVVVLIVIAAVTAPKKDKKASADTTSTTTEQESTTTDPTTTTVATTTVPPTTTTVAIPPPVVFDGNGDDVLSTTNPGGKPGAIMYIKYSGRENFVVKGQDLYVNTIGAYEGSVLSQEPSPSTLTINASGPWHIEMRSLLAARYFDTTISGHGDDVLIYTGGSGALTITNAGESNFVIRSYTISSESTADLLVNEIGNYAGTVPISGRSVIAVTSDGDWSIALRP